MISVDGINDPSLERKLMPLEASAEVICNTDHGRLEPAVRKVDPLGGSSVHTCRQAKNSYRVTTFSNPFIQQTYQGMITECLLCVKHPSQYF